MKFEFQLSGVVLDHGTGKPLGGVLVKAYDRDLIYDDLVGTCVTDEKGSFKINFNAKDFQEAFDKNPDIYLNIYTRDGKEMLHTSAETVKLKQGIIKDFIIRIPEGKLTKPSKEPRKMTFALLDRDMERIEDLKVGMSVYLKADGLKRNTVYTVQLFEEKELLFSTDFMANLKGGIDTTVLWPQFGLNDPNAKESHTLKEAVERWSGRAIQLSLLEKGGKEVLQSTTLKVSDRFAERQLFVSDGEGRLQNSIDVKSSRLYFTTAGLEKSEEYEIMLVPHQQEWEVGNLVQPVDFRSGQQARLRFELNPELDTIQFAEADNVFPGAYDVIIRPIRYGYELNESEFITVHDIRPERFVTSLTVREDFWTAKPVLGGCVNKLPISGRRISGTPYFRYANTFTLGEDVWGALDPEIVDPGNVSKMCAMYVIPSKTAAQWNANTSLNHLATLGGNAAVQEVFLQPGCVNYNRHLLWPGANIEGEYDIVADFGNNSATAAGFVKDNSYDTPLDIIDGYLVAGFRVVADPGTMSDFTHVGNWNYTETTQGIASVDDEPGFYSNPGGFVPVTETVNRRAHVFFPADAPGATAPGQISASQADYPCVVIVHGNGHNYVNYDFVLEHLARNGFIAASIHLNGGMGGLGRANMLFEHLNILNTAFGASMQNNIGIMGHSRGGEGVFKAARLNQSQALGHNINAIISLGPTDHYGREELGGAFATPLFMLYGSRDGDVGGGAGTNSTRQKTGFALYDRATGAEKSMAFVYRGTHNGFITSNFDATTWGGEAAADLASVPTQQAITLAYMNAFFRKHQKNDNRWDGMFTGEWQPASVESTGVEMFFQYENPGARVIDDFQDLPNNWQQSSIGDVVTDNGTLPANPEENTFYEVAGSINQAGLDTHSPHDGIGLLVRWNSSNDELTFDIPAADKDVSGFKYVSIRIAQKEGSAFNAANQDQELRLELEDGSGDARAIRTNAFGRIPFPDQRAQAYRRKSAMNNILIPLTSYTITCAGQVKVDLTDVRKLSLKFTPNQSGEIEIDSVSFTN
ncbi:MAG: hypothetical protein MI810_09195 [Flavobacteriales bacterium]|nr:hypothetical protein [Flavobacteriales bacterium]